MSKSHPRSFQDLEFGAPEAAKLAARRAGLSLADWIDTVVAEKADRLGIYEEDLDEDERLDAVIERLTRLKLRRSQDDSVESLRRLPRDFSRDSHVRPPVYESRSRNSRDYVTRENDLTGHVLGRVMEKLESMEQRLAPPGRQTARGRGKTGHDNEAVLAEALARLEERLDATVSNTKSRRKPSGHDAMAHIAPVGPQADQHALASRDSIFATLETKLNALKLSLDTHSASGAGDGASSASDRFENARPSRPRLEEAAPPRVASWVNAEPRAAEPSLSASAFDQLHAEIAKLATHMEAMRQPNHSADVNLLRQELAEMARTVANLAPRRSIEDLEERMTRLLNTMSTTHDEALARSVLAPLTKLVIELREATSQLHPNASLTAIEQQILLLANKVSALETSGYDAEAFATLQNQSQKIHGLVQQLAQRPNAFDALEHQIGYLTEKIENLALLPSRTSPQEVVEAIDAIRTLVDRKLATSNVEVLERRVEDLAVKIDQALSRPHLVHDKSAPVPAPDHSALEAMVRQLAQKMDEARQPEADTDAFAALQQQISVISAQMDKSQSNFSVLASLEHSIKDLFREIDMTRQMAVENAEQAARLAARESTREILENLPQSATLPQIDQLSRSIQEMCQSQDAVDQRAQETLNAVHSVLEKITGRLVAIEEDLAEAKDQPVSVQRPEAAWEPIEPRVNLPQASSARVKMPVAEPAQFIEPQRSREWAQPPVAQDFSVSRDAGRAPATFEEDFLLEPRSSARATHASPNVSFDPPSLDGAIAASAPSPTTKTEFIAAARRAAQAATQSTQQQLDISDIDQPEDKPGTPRALLERARAFTEKRKRPLLLGLAAMMIAVLGVQLVRTVGTHDIDGPSTTNSSQIQSVKPGEPALPRADSAAPKPAPKAEPPAPSQAMSPTPPLVPAEPKMQAPPQGAPAKTAPLTTPIFKDVTRAPSALNNVLGPPTNFVKGVMALNTRGFVMTRAMPGKKPNAVDLTPLASVQGQGQPDVIDAAVPSPSAQTQAQAAGTASQPTSAPSTLPQATALVAPDVDRSISPPTSLTSPSQPQMPASIDPASRSSAGLKAAAQMGNPAAQYELATRFLDGRGETRDFKAAATLLEKAANQGLAPAQYRLGALYEKGLGVPRDLAQAKMLYERSAKNGNPRAMHNLAVLTAEGATGSPDYAGAVTWFRRAAEYGIRDSQFNLAVLYARGLGVSQDLSQSYIWFALAAAQGDEDAGHKRDDVASKMDPAKLEAAKASVSAFRTKVVDSAAVEVATPVGGWDSFVPKAENRNFTTMPSRKAS